MVGDEDTDGAIEGTELTLGVNDDDGDSLGASLMKEGEFVKFFKQSSYSVELKVSGFPKHSPAQSCTQF